MQYITYNLSAPTLTSLTNLLTQWKNDQIISRIWAKDPFVWNPDSSYHTELANRLGWLHLPEQMLPQVPELEKIANEVKTRFTKIVLLGMGGSSLAPEVFSRVYGNAPGYPALSIIDSTHPGVIQQCLATLELEKTMFVMASKSGGTAETNSFFYTFYHALQEKGLQPGEHFIALTDPDTSLEKLALEKRFAYVVSTPPEVGGRYSALTPFGMLPAALMGIDVRRFLQAALELQNACSPQFTDENNPGLYLGAILGLLAEKNINKITFITSPEIALFPQWVEQLVAESTGKHGKGILPIADEPLADIANYQDDRAFVFIQLKDSVQNTQQEFAQKLIQAGFPVISVVLDSVYDLAAEFYRWEMATAVASVVLQINPFDQPDVQLAKTLAGESLKAYKETGALPVETAQLVDGNMQVFGSGTQSSAAATIQQLLADRKKGDYLCLQGFIPYAAATDEAVTALRNTLLTKYNLCSTFGYGPRFLHSTGQLHKGGPDEGIFIQITDEIQNDLEVSGQGYSFGTLITAQAQGDAKALKSRNRRFLKIHISGNIAETLQLLAKNL